MRFFFFKQKTAYEFVSRDWSSDVCSSDLISSDFFLEGSDKKSTQNGETVQILPLVLDRQMGYKLMLVRKN